MRNKRLWLAALVCAALLLTGCGAAAAVRKRPAAQLQLYYRAVDGGYDTQLGALAAEDAPEAAQTPEALLALYCAGPREEGHALPFAQDDSCTVDDCRDGVLTLRLQTKTRPEGVDATILAACLTRTMTQLDAVTSVRLLVETADAAGQELGPYTAESFLLADTSGEAASVTVTLYLPDRAGKLAASPRVLSAAKSDQLPLLALQALFEADAPAIPDGTQALDLSVTNGTAALVLSAEFLGCDVSQTRAQQAVRAVAATLCALDGIEAVQLTVVGAAGLSYCDISQPLTPSADWFAD